MIRKTIITILSAMGILALNQFAGIFDEEVVMFLFGFTCFFIIYMWGTM